MGCIEFQLRSDREAFCVNLGVHFDFIPESGKREPPDPETVRPVQCELRTRLERNGEEVWWT